ncbi:MAG TPA: hypothetical protein VGV87_04415 [Blastocatellia bacterium]|jgi:hypothetical protein|nr:hypothetical protein [Blastocatellia bacterium]
MKRGFIESHIRRGNRNLLIIGVALTIIGGGLTVLFRQWFPVLILVAGVIALVAWLKRVASPRKHPVYKQLACYGDAHNLAAQVNREFAAEEPSTITHFGENWLAQGDTYGLSLVSWSDIVWLHIDIRTRGGIRSSCYVRVWSRDGKQFVAPAGVRPGEAEQLLEELRARAPWAEAGYSEELHREWNKRRAEFITRVDARKALFRAPVAAKSASGYSGDL